MASQVDGCRKERVLVTGAGGFVGSHLVEALVRAGIPTRALVHYHSDGGRGWLSDLAAPFGEPLSPEVLEIVASDVRDADAMRRVVQDCSRVFHLAGLISIPHSYAAPASYIDTNVQGTLTLLQAARAVGVQRFVYVSSSEVYGSAQAVPMTEDHPLSARSPYAASKIGAEQLVLSFHRAFGVPATIVRPFNMFGPRQSGRAILPTIALQLLEGRSELTLGALHPTRDFNFVKDSVQALLAVSEHSQAVGEIFNIATGREVSVGNLALLLAELVGTPVSFVHAAERVRPAEVDRHIGSSEKLARCFGWRPRYEGHQGFVEAVRETLDWYRNPRNRQHYGAASYRT